MVISSPENKDKVSAILDFDLMDVDLEIVVFKNNKLLNC